MIKTHVLVLRDSRAKVIGTADIVPGGSGYEAGMYDASSLIGRMREGDMVECVTRRLTPTEAEKARTERAEADREGEKKERADDIARLQAEIERIKRVDASFADTPITPVPEGDLDLTF